jgi:ABC-type transport system involved in multi-copper enzyme maturation permease subunit
VACPDRHQPSHDRPASRKDLPSLMATLEQLLAIARNTFFESIRQPVLLVVLLVAGLLVVLSNPFSAYTLENDNRMFVDIGLSTIFIGGAVLAAFVATNVLTREIDNRTVLTVVSKPVSRPIFVIGKYLGVAVAQLAVLLFLSLLFMLVEIHGVQETVTTPYHLPVILFGFGAVLLGTAAGIWCNFFYGWVFSSTFVMFSTPLLLLAYGLSLLLGPDFTPQPPAKEFEGQLWLAVATLLLGELVLTAIALAASTRLGQVLTLVTTIGMFVLGLLSDWLLGRRIGRLDEMIMGLRDAGATVDPGILAEYWSLKTAYAIVPNFQVFWLADAITQEATIPTSYVTAAVPYGLSLIVLALAIAIVLFQRREVG